MIRLLLALYPRVWRRRYGEEFRALLETTPLTARTLLDVLRNAARQHTRAHGPVIGLLTALSLSCLVEVVAMNAHLTANILWPPTTALRTVALLGLLAPWVPVAADVVRVIRRRRLVPVSR